MTSKAQTNNDVEALTAEPNVITLTSGSVVRVQRLKTRQLLRLLKIFTAGAADALGSLEFDREDTEGFAQQLLALIVLSIPEAEDETIEFIQALILPARFEENPKTKAAKEANQKLIDDLYNETVNPEIEDLISIFEVVFRAEAEDMIALGKRVGALVKTVTPSRPKN